MTLYNVHLYREMRLLFERIEAETPEEAAALARDRLTEDANDIEDCDGDTFAALVDVVGDDQYEQSVMIDFEGERLRKAAPELLECLEYFATFAELNDDGEDELFTAMLQKARVAIASVTATHQPTVERSDP